MAKIRRKFTQCPNCNYAFEDINNFCPNCGQENHDLNVPLKHLIAEFFEGTMHFDTKVWRTLKYLITKPGWLTEKFNNGQRASYVPPFRLYVFISLLFFTALALRSNNTVKTVTEKKVEKQDMTLEEMAALTQADSVISFVSGNLHDSNQSVQHSIGNKFDSYIKNGDTSKQKFLKNTSFMMFILMPFFGLILHLFYSKQRRNYVEHLMFSVHYHTFFFILVLLGLGIEFLYPSFNVDFWAFGLALLYLFLALHRVYKQTYLRTFFKMLPVTAVYLATMVVMVLCTLFISILMS
jgi:hypothetical protein